MTTRVTPKTVTMTSRSRWIPSGGAILLSLFAALAGGCDAPTPVVPEPLPPPAPSTPPAPPEAVAPTADAREADEPAAPPEEPVRLNVVVLTIDAMRADMPWAGYPRDIAPRLTALEKESVSYTRAYAISSSTAMSMAGFLAGRYPGELERSGYFFSAYPDEVLFFPELLQQANVRTLSGHAHFYFDEKSGFRQAFDVYRMVEGISVDNTTDRNVTSPQHLALAKEILGDPANADQQFFAWFHFMDPHDEYVRHEGIDFGPRARDRYDGEILFTDRHIGELLDFIAAQPWGERTAIIVTADHGEAFGEHNMTRHGFELWEPIVRVPMFMKIPGVAPRRIDEPRSAIDLAPTIFELLDVPPHPDFQGTSLIAEARGEVEPERREVILDLPRTSDNFRRRALVWGRHKLIAFGDDFRYELYDVEADPGERIDLRRRDPELYKQMKERYLKRIETIRDVCPKMRHRLKGKRPEKPC